jgi:hypothetical protein
VLTPDDVATALATEPPVADPVVSDRCRRPDDPIALRPFPWHDDTGADRRRRRPPEHTVEVREGEAEHTDAALTVAAGGLVDLRPAPGTQLELRVLAAPAVSAGVRDSDHAATFEPGRRVVVGGDGPFEVWNDGPGPLRLELGAPRRAWGGLRRYAARAGSGKVGSSTGR